MVLNKMPQVAAMKPFFNALGIEVEDNIASRSAIDCVTEMKVIRETNIVQDAPFRTPCDQTKQIHGKLVD
jgi:hypothetical protein